MAQGAEEKHEKRAMKREGGIDYPPEDYAWVPLPDQPSSWKLLLAQGAPGRITLEQLGRAAAALSPGGFRGNRAEIPPTALSAVKRRIRAEYRRLKVPEQKIPASVKETQSFAVWKEANSERLRWFAVYSNNYRDDDDPPEIISAKSHETFVALVDAGIVDYPELWHWHLPGTAWGKADWLEYADGFALASGLVYPGHEKEAAGVAAFGDIRVSHGMPSSFLSYRADDPSVIDFHVTTEISSLPGWAAANKLTSFVVIGDDEMAIRSEKREYLRQIGVEEERIDALEAGLKEMKEEAEAAALASKEQATGDPAPEPVETQTESESSEAVAQAETEPEAVARPETGRKETPVLEEVSDPPAEPTPVYATRDEVAAVLNETFGLLAENIQSLHAAVAELQSSVKELKAADAEKVAAIKEVTPTASLRELMAQNLIGKESAAVDGRTKLGQAGPKETETALPNVTPVPFVNGLIQQSLG